MQKTMSDTLVFMGFELIIFHALFLYRSKGKCCRCEKFLDEAPIMLPCSHIVCEKCLLSIQQSAQKTCSTCRKEIGTDFDVATTEGNLR